MITRPLLPALVLIASSLLVAQQPPVTGAFAVAHRGASFYAPEHTMAAYRLALEQHADYVEQDLVITRDRVLVCLHDPTLERTTDVEELYPERYTETTVDGQVQRRWYPEDFTLAEIKRLDAGAWFDPSFAGERVPTFQEAIDLVRGKAGLFPELKNAGRLRARGFDLEQAVAAALQANGLVGTRVNGRPAVHLQAFEEDSIRRLATLTPDVPRTLLIGSATQAARWLSEAGLDELKGFATGVGPARQLIDDDPALVARAHARGMTVVPYTFRLRGRPAPPALLASMPAATRARVTAADDRLPATREALTAEMRRFVDQRHVDGLFTDNPDLFPR